MDETTRRQFVSTASLLSIGVIAGCGSDDGGGGVPPDEDNDSDDEETEAVGDDTTETETEAPAVGGPAAQR